MLFLSQEHFQVECLSSTRCRYAIFACVVLKRVHVHSLFTFETVFFPERLPLIDSNKQLNQQSSLLNCILCQINMRKSFYLFLFLISY